MGLFGQSVFREFEGMESGYYFQVFLNKPKENMIRFNPTRMWETEREALKDLPYIIPTLVSRDSSDPDILIFKDLSILYKNIFIVKVKQPNRIDSQFAKIDDIEHDTVQKYLDKNKIMYKVKLHNTSITNNRNRVVSITMMDIREGLKNTKYAKKCLSFDFKNNMQDYSAFVIGDVDRLTFAHYDAYRGIPNPRKNEEALKVMYSELRKIVDSTNIDLINMGYRLNMTDNWDFGFIEILTITSLIGENKIIYEEPSNLKIDGQPVEDEDDNSNYSIQNEPDDENDQTDETQDQETNTDVSENDEVEETEDDNVPDQEEESDDVTDYRIPDTEEETSEGEPETQDNEEVSDSNEDQDETSDYRINPDEESDEGGFEEEAPNNDEENSDYRVDSNEEDVENGSEENDSSNDEDMVDNSGENSDDMAKKEEEEIFSNMSPEQRRIQDEELKENYIKLYNTIGDLIGRLDQISVNNMTREPMDFVQNQMIDLKSFVFKYLTEVYSTKTYIENNINYQQYLAILSNINNILIQLNTKSVDIE